MKRIICSFIMMIILYLLQTTIFNKIAIAGIKPNILIILVVFIGYKYGKIQGMIMGFFMGLFLDLTESDYIGYYALIYLTIGYLVGFSDKLYTSESVIIPMGLVGLSDFVLNFLIFVTGFLLRNRLDLPYYMMKIILPEAIYTVIVSAVLYKAIDYIYLRLEMIGKGDEV
ncbi:MAG: rod shape-determining protein MreD [Catonella sp.]|uniref:rod shape-determining protein MreD n=1 Tax=Catonella sp. TaxID=2382125 RepID=UPI003F9F2B46